ncbi:MAG: glycosyltransferase [Bacteroidales bacterium]|jgi:spore maturation protein CgeB|nr:glycosyltransferase [Bacteroidales bacterium]
MKKILIISSPFYDYHRSVGRAFETFGYKVHFETYDMPIHPFKGLLKWKHKFANTNWRERLKAQSRNKFDIHIRQVYNQYQPNIVFIYNGTILLDETLDYFRQKSKVLLWMYDSVLNPRYARNITHIDHVDAMFCFEKKDVDYYESIGKISYFLPLACDDSVYYSIPNQNKDIDIFFVGAIWMSKRRMKILEMLVNCYPNLKILIYGKYKPIEKNFLKWLLRKNRNIFTNINIQPKKVNEFYNRCKVALNIHHEQTTYGSNQRVFEACGAGAYQICDANPFIEQLFPNGEVGLYHNDEELIALIEDALNNDKTSQAKEAQQIILSSHTFVNRVQEMLEILYKLN